MPPQNPTQVDPTTGQMVAPPPVESQPQQSMVTIGQYVCWYFPEKSMTIFAARKATVELYQGLLLLRDANTKQEVFRLPLGADLKLQTVFGGVKFDFVNGEKLGMFSKKYNFYFYNPKLYFLSYLFVFSGMGKAKAFAAACKQAAGLTA
jgi:hypothetical protein